jgi:hypothetical protein
VSVATASGTEEQVVAGFAAGYVYASSFTPADEYIVRARPGFHLAVEHDADCWIVTDPETGVHGAGESPSDALADFLRAASEHVDVLERQPALSDDLAAQLRYLRDRI